MDRFRGKGCYACDRLLHNDQKEWTNFCAEPAKYRCCRCNCSLLMIAGHDPNAKTRLEQHHIIWEHNIPYRICQKCRIADYMNPNTEQGCWVCGTKCNPKDKQLVVYVDDAVVNIRFTACKEEHFDSLLSLLSSSRIGWCSSCNLMHKQDGSDGVLLEVTRRSRKDMSSWLDRGAWNTWIRSWRDSSVIWDINKYTTPMRR